MFIFVGRLRFRFDYVPKFTTAAPIPSTRYAILLRKIVASLSNIITLSMVAGERPTPLIRVATGGTLGGSVFQPQVLVPPTHYSSKTVSHFEDCQAITIDKLAHEIPARHGVEG